MNLKNNNVVVSVSKIEISKAIHNILLIVTFLSRVVVSVSKIEISKAIHNISPLAIKVVLVVVSVSKIEISKAIHNLLRNKDEVDELLSVCQR